MLWALLTFVTTNTILLIVGLIFIWRIKKQMATQEQRLQTIATKIDEVLADLQTLKENNPQIEDEIAAIEAKLSIAQPTGGDTGGGTV